MSVWFDNQSINATTITDENFAAQAVAFTNTDSDPAYDGVSHVYTDQYVENWGGSSSSTKTFSAYFDSANTLLFYESLSRDSYSADPNDTYESLYRYDSTDTQIFYESGGQGYFNRFFIEELSGGGYVEVYENGDDFGFSRNETTYDATGNRLQTVSENDQNGYPERNVENYDAIGNFLDGTRESFYAVATLDSNRDVLSRTLDPTVVSELGGVIAATAGSEQSRGSYKVTVSNTEVREAPAVSASDPMYGTSGQSGGTTTMSQSVTLFLDADQSTVLALDASSTESSGTWERVEEVTYKFDSTGIKVAETITREESENGVVTYSTQETSELVNGWMEIQERIEVSNGLETTTSYVNGMPDSVSTAIAIDTSSAADFNATNFADLFAYDIDDLYAGATKAVEISNDDGTMGAGSSKTILLVDDSDAIQGSIEMWPMWGYDGQVISGQYSYSFYDSEDNWIGNLTDDGTNFYKSVVTETTQTFDETVGLDETALGVDLNFDGDQADANVKFDYNGDGDTLDASVAVNVRIESGGGGASGQAASDTYEWVYRASDWTLLSGTESRGVTLTEYGPNWVKIGETTTLPNDVVFEEISIDGSVAYRVEIDGSGGEAGGYPGMGGGQQTEKAVFIYAADKTTVIERHEIWEWTEDRGEGETFTSTSISKFDGNGNFIGSSWSDSDGGFSNYTETVEERTFQKYDTDGVTLIEVTDEVRVQTNESGGPYMGFYASEYLYDPDTWEFYGGFEVMDGRKTLYGPNWQVLDEVRAVDTSNVEFVAITDNTEVLEPFRSEVTQKIVYAEQSQEFSYGSSSSQDTEYFDANQTLVYLAEKSVWTDAEDRSNTNITFYDADNNWIGNSSSDASGWSSTNFRYVADVIEGEVGYDLNGDGDQSDTVRMEVEEGSSSSTGGQSESWTYYYEEGNWALVYGEQSSNGVLTKYGQHWEVIEQTFDLSGKDKVTTDDGYYVEFSNGVFQDYAMAGGGQSESKRVVYFDTSDQVIKSKEVWRWAEGSYWSESFSLYDADGQWIGGGWEDSDGNYSENSETEIVDDSGNVTGRISEGINKNSGWSDEYYYEYDVDWSLVSGYQISNNMKTTYGAGWEVLSTEYVVNTDDLVEVRDDAGTLIGYQVVESGTDVGGGMWGSSSWSRATNLDLEQNIIGSVETWRWEDSDGFWSEDTSRYDADGNWIGSVYESSDGYYSSYSQTTETIDGQIRVVSAGSNKDGDGYSYSYRYVYDESWNLVEGWEINGSVKVIYDSSWNIVGREAVQDDTTEYQEIRNKLDQLIGYRTEDTQTVDSADGAFDTSVNVTLYDLAKEITRFIEIDRFEETEGYWSEVRTEYDADRQMLLMRNEDSDGWFEEFEWTYGATTTTESGVRTQDEGVFEWTYVYDSTGALQAGSETFQGITYEYGPDWTFVRKIADVDDLEGLDNVTVQTDSEGAVTGYEIVETESYTDPLGTYSSSSSSTSTFDDAGAFLGSTETWTWTDSVYGGSSSGVSMSNGRDQQTYGHSIDATGQFYAQGDTASLSGEQTIWELSAGPNYLFAGYGIFGSPSETAASSGFKFYDEELTVIDTGDEGVITTVSYAPSDFFSTLLRSTGWSMSETVSEAAVAKFNLPSGQLSFVEELAVVEAFAAFDYEDFLKVKTADVNSESFVVRDDDSAYAMRFTGQINSLVDGVTGKKYVNEANSRFSEVEIFAAKSSGGFDLNDATTMVAEVDNLSIGLSSLENALLDAYQLSELNEDATTAFLEVV